MKLGSFTPANETNLFYFFKLFDTALAILVLPVPGGPYNNKTKPFELEEACLI